MTERQIRAAAALYGAACLMVFVGFPLWRKGDGRLGHAALAAGSVALVALLTWLLARSLRGLSPSEQRAPGRVTWRPPAPVAWLVAGFLLLHLAALNLPLQNDDEAYAGQFALELLHVPRVLLRDAAPPSPAHPFLVARIVWVALFLGGALACGLLVRHVARHGLSRRQVLIGLPLLILLAAAYAYLFPERPRTFYRWIFMRWPPSRFSYVASVSLFGIEPGFVRLPSLLATGVAGVALARTLGPRPFLAVFATACFLFTPSLFYWGGAAVQANFGILAIVLCLVPLLRYVDQQRPTDLALACLLAAAGFVLAKRGAVLLLGVIPVAALCVHARQPRDLLQWFRRGGWGVAVASLVPLFAFHGLTREATYASGYGLDVRDVLTHLSLAYRSHSVPLLALAALGAVTALRNPRRRARAIVLLAGVACTTVLFAYASYGVWLGYSRHAAWYAPWFALLAAEALHPWRGRWPRVGAALVIAHLIWLCPLSPDTPGARATWQAGTEVRERFVWPAYRLDDAFQLLRAEAPNTRVIAVARPVGLPFEAWRAGFVTFDVTRVRRLGLEETNDDPRVLEEACRQGETHVLLLRLGDSYPIAPTVSESVARGGRPESSTRFVLIRSFPGKRGQVLEVYRAITAKRQR